MSDYEMTQEIINLEDMGEPIAKSRDEWRFHCPNCLDKRGKQDLEGKMYYNIDKQKGYCFKCSTSFYPEQSGVDQDEIEWERIQRDFKSRIPLAIFDDMEEPKEIAFDFPVLEWDQIWYLKKRNPYVFALKDWLGFRGWSGKENGVVLPFFYKGKICKFQCRFMERTKGMKYYTSPGPKPMYSPMHILNDFRLSEGPAEVTICEGVFDAIALWVIGFPNPLAILGDKITPLQLYDIRSLSPLVTKAFVCLDDWDRSLSVAKVLKRHVPGLQDTEIFTKWGNKGDDPEDFLKTTMGNPEAKQEYTQRVSEFMLKVLK